MKKSCTRLLVESAAAFLLFFLLGCARPLGSGYQIESESLEARYVSSSPPHLAIHSAYGLKNFGDHDLEFVEVTLPDEKMFTRRNLRVRVGDREGETTPAPQGPANLVRIAFDDAWAPKQRRSLVLDYDLFAAEGERSSLGTDSGSGPVYGSGSSSDLGATNDGVYLQVHDVFPDLRRPREWLASVQAAKRADLSIRMPEDFRVLVNARSAGVRRQQNDVQHRFRLGGRDFGAFVIAGRYQERSIAAEGGTVVFWTFEPVPAQIASRVAERLAAARKAYENAFGSLPEKSSSVWVVEIPGFHAGPREDGASASFPGVVLARPSLLAKGANEDVLEVWDKEMARSWFGQLIGATNLARLVFGSGAATYAATVATEAREGPAARQRAIDRLRSDYDEARASLNGAAEKPLSAIAPSDPPAQRRLGEDKAALFFLALEDKCGEANVRHAIAHLIHSLSGHEVSPDDLRSAVEQESGHDIAEFFTTWLHKTGITK